MDGFLKGKAGKKYAHTHENHNISKTLHWHILDYFSHLNEECLSSVPIVH